MGYRSESRSAAQPGSGCWRGLSCFAGSSGRGRSTARRPKNSRRSSPASSRTRSVEPPRSSSPRLEAGAGSTPSRCRRQNDLGVLFTRGLLEALTPEETAAIFAHEVAHLEHFQPRKVLLGRALALVLLVLPIFLWAGPLSDFLRGWEWIWPIAFLIAMTAKAGRNRAHEAESDRRALELSPDPDALVSGLTKLHSLNRLSRRWDAAFESLSTHPSLARRIRAIRAVSGKQVPEEELEASLPRGRWIRPRGSVRCHPRPLSARTSGRRQGPPREVGSAELLSVRRHPRASSPGRARARPEGQGG